MNSARINRRKFIKTTGLTSASLALMGSSLLSSCNSEKVLNTIPRWKGFNLLDYFGAYASVNNSNSSTEDDFKWMRDWGFDFVRIPMAYPRYLKFDPSKPIAAEETYNIDEAKVEEIVSLVEKAQKHNLHVSLNLHRAPGYCVNAGFHEPFNLWKDKAAQDSFLYHWEMWAKVFENVSSEKISFDLVNEPSMREDMNDQHGERTTIPGEIYRKVAKAAAERIRSVNPNHLVIADGNDVGSSVIPEITDLNIAQSCRGYYPHWVSHYQAPWAMKNPESAPMPVWPGEMNGEYFDKGSLEKLYQPWTDLVKQGVGVHCGECGCWKKTPHEVFLAWFEDVLSILTEHGIGYALWNFRGDFGIMDSGREDVQYEDWHGYKLDRKLLNLLMKY
ncbi:MAG: cellulase family glycosylhydrolase [Prolixibacteraceae bacterium]|jgi:endoglucanase|nr:cellulase family glycosylhydrolase [Prolixibacteraceae bacterium]